MLAAGEGRRIGGPKALLRIGAQTFLERSVERLARPGVAEIVAVVGHQAERVAGAVRLPAGARLVENTRHAEGMLGSILSGLAAAEESGAEGVLLHLVDHPLVETASVDRVIAALEAGAVVVVPSHEGRRGHPAGFARAAWPALRAASPERGARALLADHPD